MTGMAGLLTAIVALVQLFGHDPKPDPVPPPPVQDSTAAILPTADSGMSPPAPATSPLEGRLVLRREID
ncbi:MAG: hypothetical protein NUW01_12540 [Gemmatimonadaceae bacterium]|nr:hypothetical protein [Gemmatimonadaceae bacterium]